MKKYISFGVMLLAVASCVKAPEVSVTEEVSPAFYADWDRAVRIDVDLQNMYADTPQKIEKPIDMYMAFALALKNNYTRRLAGYQESLLKAGKSPVSALPEIASKAGYVNINGTEHVGPDLKIAWDMLDISTIYYQSQDSAYKANVAVEQSRKVIHNLLQETRALYWRTLMAQKLLPTIDNMIEFMTLEVDEMNAKNQENNYDGAPIIDLVKKRKYMQAVKDLSLLKRKMETSEVNLAALMGFHPSTEYKLVGPEYGNFALPELKNSLSQLEWVALNNRPELRARDLVTNVEEIKIYSKEYVDPGQKKYKKDARYYNKSWLKKAQDISVDIFENVKNPSESEMETLRRQRMTNLVLSQVYVSWARYMSSLEDYEISEEIAGTSEDIAEDTTGKSGSKAEKSQLESAKAIEDEASAYMAYVELQDSLGNLYATLGLDAIPYYMLNEKLSKIAIYLRGTMEKWRQGEFLPDNRPYILGVPAKRPPVELSSPSLMPDIEVESGQRVSLTIPQEILSKMDFKGKVITKAGLVDDSPLPAWLNYDEKTYTFSGLAMPSEVGEYKIKVYVADENNNVGYLTFKIKVKEVYVPSMSINGLPGRNVMVLKRCLGKKCTDEYVSETEVGKEVGTTPRY